MKRIKLCWSIARIINAHRRRHRHRQIAREKTNTLTYTYTNTYTKLIIKALKSICCRGCCGGLGQTAKCWQNKRQQPSVASDSAAGVDTNFSSPYPKPPSSSPPSPSKLLLLLLLRAIKRWFPAFCLQFSAISLQTHTHAHRQKHVYCICPLTLH